MAETMKSRNLKEEYAATVAQVRHGIGVLLATACARAGVDGEGLLKLKPWQVREMILGELEHEMVYDPVLIASDVLDGMNGHPLPDRDPDLDTPQFRVWNRRKPSLYAHDIDSGLPS